MSAAAPPIKLKVRTPTVRTTYPPPGRALTGAPSATLAELKVQSGDVLMLRKAEVQTESKSDPVPASVPEAVSLALAPAHVTAPRASSPAAPTPASLAALSHLRPLTLQPIANDNSCLFNAVGGLIEGFNACGPQLVAELRQTVAAVIQADEGDRFNEAFLGGMSKDKYAENIMKENTWGGGIELSILADCFDVEIASLDVETCHQYLFGQADDPGQQKQKRIYVVYSGVHYDALQDTDTNGGPPQRIFHPADQTAAARALLAVRQLQASGSFTNVSKFSLRCVQCNTGLVGAMEAQEHAKATGHQQFEEYQK